MTGCVRGMVVVTEEDCQAGRVDPCPPTCSHLSLDRNCTAECILGRMHSRFDSRPALALHSAQRNFSGLLAFEHKGSEH